MIVARPQYSNSERTIPYRNPRVETTNATQSATARTEHTISPSIFDHPAVYDACFAEDVGKEFARIRSVILRHSSPPAQRLLEIGCGSGRILNQFSDAGFHVAGFDRSRAAVCYANSVIDGDRCWQDEMVSFTVPGNAQSKPPFDAAYATINTFRHLQSDHDVLRHLDRVSTALRDKAIYTFELDVIVGNASNPQDVGCEQADLTRHESRTLNLGETVVNVLLWCKSTRDRIERFGTLLSFDAPQGPATLEGEVTYRTYTVDQLISLLHDAPAWDCVVPNESTVKRTTVASATANERLATSQRLAVVLRRR